MPNKFEQPPTPTPAPEDDVVELELVEEGSVSDKETKKDEAVEAEVIGQSIEEALAREEELEAEEWKKFANNLNTTKQKAIDIANSPRANEEVRREVSIISSKIDIIHKMIAGTEKYVDEVKKDKKLSAEIKALAIMSFYKNLTNSITTVTTGKPWKE